jgi:hypothetical protein
MASSNTAWFEELRSVAKAMVDSEYGRRAKAIVTERCSFPG